MEKFGIVNSDIVSDPNLSLRAKGLYAILCKYANKDRLCYPSMSSLAAEAGTSVRTIERLLKELKANAYVTREGKYFKLR